MTTRLLCDSIFRRRETQTGGGNRHAQIYDLLARVDPELAYTDPVSAGKGRLKGMLHAVRRLMPAVRPIGFNPFSKRAWINYGYNGKIWECLEQSLRKHPDAKCLVNEIQMRWSVPYFCRAHRLPWVAMPQNFEVFWKGEDIFLNRSYWAGIRFESELLRMAAHVFTISHEEQFILANLKIRADCLPYYPPAEQVAWLDSIRREREATEREDFVVFIANFEGEASVHGLREFVAKFLPPVNSRPRLVLIGWRSEMLRLELGADVGVLGGVSREKLFELFVRAKAMVVHQSYGGGALTRIPEALIAGLPVIANTFAARSAMTYDGVYTYASHERLSELLNSNLPVPSIPARPDKEEKHFCKVIENLLADSSAGQ
jgi:glycosyltransferase involved in cell wall biosynthesis